MAFLPPHAVDRLHNLYGRPRTIDDVIRLRAQDDEQHPVLAYPKNGSLSEYDLFTGKELDRCIDEACWSLIGHGVKVNDDQTIALYAQSDLSYVVTLLALLRLGCKVMTISTRLGPLAITSLLDRAQCRKMFHGLDTRVCSTVEELSRRKVDVSLRPILSRRDFEKPEGPWRPFLRPCEQQDQFPGKERVALIMHSSGSTGYPKPIFQSHVGVLGDLLTGMGCRAMNPLPWFHLHGLLTSLQAIWMRKTAYLWNTEFPLTAANMIIALRAIEPEIFHGVPYSVKLLSEVPEGIELLKKCKHVTSGGARPPDELGEKLVRAGVHFATTFGLTETGHIGDSMRRAPGDNDWAYFRLHSFAIPHIDFKPLGTAVDGQETYEAVFLESHPALLMSNSDDPPGSYYSRDIFVAHPTIPNAWKYLARNDDCITLANGEKINPMAMEGILRQSAHVRDALLFGIDQPIPGMLIFRSQIAADMSQAEYMEAISPALAEANALADDFARVAADLVVLVPHDVDYPVTDKNNIIRAAAYRDFADQIRKAYENCTNGVVAENDPSAPDKKLQLDIPGLQQYLMKHFQNVSGVAIKDLESDFYSHGVDSILAIQLRRRIEKDLDIGDAALPANVVYDSRNIKRLAAMLYTLQERNGAMRTDNTDQESGVREMELLIDNYSTFKPYVPGKLQTPQDEVVLLTGSSGALGAHLLHCLLRRSTVRHVYCLVRSPITDPRVRVLESLKERGIDLSDDDVLATKFSAYHSVSFRDTDLGLSPEVYQLVQTQVTLIIHAAWPVHFQLPLASFDSHICGTKNLLDLSLNTPWHEPARVLFASSIATAFATPSALDQPAIIPEGPVPSLSHCLPTGYAMSKLVCEKVCERATKAGARVGLLRIGQFVGDSEKGIWNRKEAIPLMVQSALVVQALPLLNGPRGLCLWMPVDDMAKACLQVGDMMRSAHMTSDGGHVQKTSNPGQLLYFNLVSPHVSRWNEDVLPALRHAGVDFKEVPFHEWISKVGHRSAELADTAGEKLPASKLLQYYRDLYRDDGLNRLCIPQFELSKALLHLPALRDSADPVKVGLIEKFVREWSKHWAV